MKKIIFSICFVLITLMGIACVSACDANNCTVDNQQISECDIDNYYFETLNENHDVSEFDCGDEDLNDFLKNDALAPKRQS